MVWAARRSSTETLSVTSSMWTLDSGSLISLSMASPHALVRLNRRYSQRWLKYVSNKHRSSCTWPQLLVSRPFCTVRVTWTTGWRCLAVRGKNLTRPDWSAALLFSLLTLSGSFYLRSNLEIWCLWNQTLQLQQWPVRFKSCRTSFLYSSLRSLDNYSQHGSHASASLPGEIMEHSLQDLITYFQPAVETLDYEAKEHNMVVLKNRQNMFQEEVNLHLSGWMDDYVCHSSNESSFQGVIDLVLDCIDHLHQHIGACQSAEAVQRDSEEELETSLNGFYKLLGGIYWFALHEWPKSITSALGLT